MARWSPSRALCYRTVFLDINELMRDVFDVALREGTQTNVLSIGGGAGAELAAAASAVRGCLPKQDPRFEHPPPTTSKLHLTAVDVAEWAPAYEPLLKNILKTYIPEKNAGIFSSDFVQADILSTDLAALVRPQTKLITLCFTTNELYTQSRGDTTKLLLSLGALVEKGCLLLVLESAGSYSTVQIGGKTFSMGMLLDHTLTGDDGEWEIIVAEEAKWYRLPQPQMINGQVIGTGLKYPLTLENMRYFVRVFRKK